MNLLTIQSGYKNFDGGKTTVEISSSGEMHVLNDYLGQKQEFRGRVDADRIRTFIKEHTDRFMKWEFGNRKGVPDEVLYHITIGNEKEGREFSLQIWQNELKKIPPLKELLKYLQKMITENTHGKLQL